jgi:hypothetical protein
MLRGGSTFIEGTDTPVELARQVKESGGATARIGSSVSMAGSPASQVESLSVIASGLEFSDEGSLVAVNEEHRSKLRPAPAVRMFKNQQDENDGQRHGLLSWTPSPRRSWFHERPETCSTAGGH